VIQTQVVVRPAHEADAAAVHRFLAGLSMDTQYQRFFTGLGAVSPSLVRDLIAVTARQQVVLALAGEVVVGHAMATTNGNTVELGVVVADGHRRLGLATRMIRDLIEVAQLGGVEGLRLDVLCENQPVLDWIRRHLPSIRFERDGHALTGYAPLERSLTDHAAEVQAGRRRERNAATWTRLAQRAEQNLLARLVEVSRK
jgi:GNAT superfamily N-acetyltransferase